MSSSKYRQQWLGGRKGPSVGSIEHLMIKKKLAAGTQWETHISHTEGKEKWIQDHVDRGTTGLC